MHLRADSSKCCGCRACQVACSLANFGENNPKKARLAIHPHFPAPCAEVCPVDAIPVDKKGVYDIDPEKCIACMACVEACPEGVIFVHPDREAPFKCIRCGQCVLHCGMSVLWIE